MKRLALILLSAATLSACTLIPHYQRPASPVTDRWPADAAPVTTSTPNPATTTNAAQSVSADQIGWRDFFADPGLQRLIEIALKIVDDPLRLGYRIVGHLAPWCTQAAKFQLA